MGRGWITRQEAWAETWFRQDITIMLEILNFILGTNGKLLKSFEQRHDINRSVLLKDHLGYRVKNELLRNKNENYKR